MNDLTVKFTVGKSEDGTNQFLEYGLGGIDNLLKETTRQYYEIVDKEILLNMPDDILIDLANKAQHELDRRHINKELT